VGGGAGGGGKGEVKEVGTAEVPMGWR